MMLLRVYASEAPELYELAERIAMLTNPQCWYDLQGAPDVERKAELVRLLGEFEEQTH